MLERAVKLSSIGHHAGVDHTDVAQARCQALLACVNALSLVDKRDAWLAVGGADDVLAVRHSKRRKVSSHIPADKFAPDSKSFDILTLDELRQEYTLAVARLRLASDFPELARSTVHLDGEGTVALFTQLGSADEAFATAQTLGVDAFSLFGNMATKCVRLTAQGDQPNELDAAWVLGSRETAGWEGDLASKAWHQLRRTLERYDPDGLYRQHVLDTILAEDRFARLPSWLVAYFVAHNLDVLLARLIHHDLLPDALKLAINSLKSTPSARAMNAGLDRLPYALFDQLLSVVLDPADPVDAACAAQQAELRAAVVARIALADKQTGSLRARVGR